MRKKNFVLALTISTAIGSTAYYVSNKAKISKGSNEELASRLLEKLKGKISHTLANKIKEPLIPFDSERLTYQCLSDEMEYTSIEHQIILPLQDMLKDKNLANFKMLSGQNFSGEKLNSLKLQTAKTLGNIKYLKFINSSKLGDNLAQNQFVSELSEFINKFSKIDSVELMTSEYLAPPNSRGEDQKMNSAILTTRFDLRGQSLNGQKLQERGQFKITVKRNKEDWKISSISMIEREQLTTKIASYTNITHKSGLASLVPSHLRREAIRRGGYAMAIGDYNKDEHVDFFIGTVAESLLLKSNEDNKFSDVTPDIMNRENLVKAASFADFNNNGYDDLLLVRFAPNESQSKNDRSDILIYKSNGTDLVKAQNIIDFQRKTAYAMPIAVADFDNDSFLDFYVGFPGAKDFTTLEEPIQAKELANQGLFFNQKKGKLFKSDPYENFKVAYDNSIKKYGVNDSLSNIYPHSALATDYNNDGKVDLLVIDDRGNLSPIYTNQGKGKFKFSNDNIGLGLKDYGMGAATIDLNNDGKTDFLMSSVNFNSSKRVKTSCQKNWKVDDTISAGVKGLRAFEANDNGTFSEATEKLSLDYVGEGAGGVLVFDYNNDGYEDIYLVNGLWSGSEKNQSQDISPLFVAASTLGILEDDLKSPLRGENFMYERIIKNNDFKSLIFRSDSQSAIMDLLSFFRGDIYNNNRNKKMAPSLAGNQRNRLFHNNGDGTFIEVGFMTGLDSIADGYMAMATDFNKDGKIDIALRNADPGYHKKQFLPVELHENTLNNLPPSVTIALVGTQSNSNAIGASLRATIGTKTLRRQLIANSGTVQSERIIHFGLGKNKKIDELYIKWPSGNTQTLKNLQPGFHKIFEKSNNSKKVDITKL